MAYVINAEKCIACGTCADQCPMGAIEKDEDSGKYVIGEECVSCGSCQGECPESAIEEE